MADSYLTLLDLAKRSKFGGGIDDVIEVLSASNPIVNDAPAREGNLPTGNRTTVRATEPTGHYRAINEGVETQKSTTNQFDDTCALIEDWSAIDEEEIRISGDKAKYRATEDDAFVSGLTKKFATGIFYDDIRTDQKGMHGLTPRYNSLSGSTATNIINASGASNLTSIWFVKWSPTTAHLIYPKGTKGGIQSEDLGLIPWTISSKHLRAWVTQYVWHVGLAVKDYRYISRICNIDYTALTDDAATGADLLRKMISAYYKVPTEDIGKSSKTFIYCNKTIAEYLHVQAMNKSNVNLTLDNVAGQPVTRFLGIPVHVCDNITNAETAVS
jgi:hypothetical protein